MVRTLGKTLAAPHAEEVQHFCASSQLPSMLQAASFQFCLCACGGQFKACKFSLLHSGHANTMKGLGCFPLRLTPGVLHPYR